MGFTTSALVIAVQNSVDWGYRGVSTASVQFMRTIGGSVTIAVMGAVLNSQLESRFAAVPGVPEGATEATLLNVEERTQISPGVLDEMQGALATSLNDIYILLVVVAVVAFSLVLFFPRGRAHDLVRTARAGQPAR
jgi:hypothetical protein